jgi:hypothetical protein
MSTPVGAWTATVELPHRTRDVELTFQPDGVAVVREGETVAGTGTWAEAGEDRFTYELVELIPGGCVVVSQDGFIGEGTFRGTGVTKVYDDDGQLVRAVPAWVQATAA